MKEFLLMFFLIINGDPGGIHPPVVWSEDGDVGNKHRLMVLCVFQTGRHRIAVRLEKGIRKTQGKLHGEIRDFDEVFIRNILHNSEFFLIIRVT